MLTGSALLAKVKELGQQPRDVIAIACGYTRKDGKPAFTPFFEALNAAHGLTLPPVAAKPKRGKPLTWTLKPSAKGALVVAPGYTEKLALGPDDRVTVALEGDALVLRKAPSSPEKAPQPVAVVVTPSQAPATAPEPATAAERELAPF